MKNKILLIILLTGFLSISLKVNSQIARRTFGTANNETNSFVVDANGGDFYVISGVNTANGDIMVSKYNSAATWLWRKSYDYTTHNQQVVSCIRDIADNLVLLVNDYTNDKIYIHKINPADGTTLNYWEYTNNLLAGQDFRGVKIAQGTDENYYFIANQTAGNFDDAYIFRVNSSTGALMDSERFDYNNGQGSDVPFGFYDFAQLEDNTWVISGAWLDLGVNRYDAFAIVFDFTPGFHSIVEEKLFTLNADHDGFDRVVVDHGRSQIYFGCHTDDLSQIDVAVLCTDYNLNQQWYTLMPTTGAGQSERLSCMIYNGDVDRIVLSGFNQVGNEYGFITSIDANGNYEWTKYPKMTVANTFPTSFRIDMQGSLVLYASDYLNTNRDVFYGAELFSSEPGNCFEAKAYEPTNDQFNPFELTFLHPDVDVSVASRTLLPVEVVISDKVACSNCELPETGFVKLYDATISTNTFFGDQASGIKYYIEGTLTVDPGVTLDITNIDVLFGENAMIFVSAGATLRANNSVFRPCNPDKTWRGIYFDGSPKGVVNNCVFKNANYALDASTTQNNLEVTNNQFSNCLVGVRISYTIPGGGSVTGNKFFVDNSMLVFPLLNPAYGSSNTYTGVLLNQTNSNAIIAQNQFIYAKTGGGHTNQLYGIYADRSSAVISENTFTNCYRAIDLTNTLTLTVENNEIEVTRHNPGNDYQLKLVANQVNYPVKIANNRFNNYNTATDAVSNQAAIYSDFSRAFEIYDNRINGFKTGIQLRDATLAKVYSNHIIGSVLFGIHAENCHQVSIRCNEIDMQYNSVLASQSTGLRYYQTNNEANSLDIRGNCIFNTHNAIVLSTTSIGATIPVIKNNYLYNYRRAGIYNDYFFGNIGTFTTPPFAGRNVFISNNFDNAGGGAIDIYSIMGINQSGNYNLNRVSAAVARVGAVDASHSTASCGHFFANNNTVRIEEEDKCDFIAEFVDGTLIDYSWPGSVAELVAENAGKVYGIENADERLLIWANAAKIFSNDAGQTDKLVKIIEAGEKSEEVKAIAIAYIHTLKGEYALAGTALQKVTFTSATMIKNKERVFVLAQMLQEGKNISTATKLQITALVTESNFFATELRSGLSPYDKGFDYVFAPTRPHNSPSFDERTIKMYETSLTIYPNPATGGSIQVEISTPTTAQTTLYVRDVLGRVVIEKALDFSAGSTTIATDGLPNGIYMVSVESDDTVLKTEKVFVNR